MSEPILLVIGWPRSRWQRVLRRRNRIDTFQSESFTRGEAREWANDFQARFPHVAVALVGEDWVEQRLPADGTRGQWDIRRSEP